MTELARHAARLAWEYSDVIPWQPHAKMRPRVSRGGRRTHQDPRDAAAEKATRDYFTQTVLECALPPLTTNVAISLRFYRQTAQVVDLDNLIKHFCDSANGVLWADDVLLTKISAELHLDRDNPRTEWLVRHHLGSTMVRAREYKTQE